MRRTWARGIVTTYSYDVWGNLTNTVYSDGTPSVSLAYDALGRQTNAVDAAGTTVTVYDDYGAEAAMSVSGLYAKTLVRHRDAYGRDVGHAMDGSRKNIIEYDAATGRIHREQLGGAWFTWSYLPGSDLKSRLSVGTAATTDWTYEPSRDLLAQVRNIAFGSVISQYDYANDALGRRTAIARSGSMMSEQRSDAYGFNDRGELTNAVRNAILNEYAYRYDDIGNRESSVEPELSFVYEANGLDQYASISNVQPSTSSLQYFLPQYDLDGNQTLIKTKTGIWSVAYNGENRPVSWTCGTTNLVMKFDRMGRRVEYVETVGSVTNRHQKFVYDGYLCIQRLNGANDAVTDLFEWNPTEPVATRPLYGQARMASGNYSLFYTHDGNKNVSETVFYQRARGVAAHYEYAPFGDVTARTRGDGWGSHDLSAINPWRFSSEYADDATRTVYYNYRHYEPAVGRWVLRDLMSERGGLNLYAFIGNSLPCLYDYRGLKGYADYKFDSNACTLEASLTFRVEFVPGKAHSWNDVGGNPDKHIRQIWKNRAKRLAETYFNGGFLSNGDTDSKWQTSNKCTKKCSKKCPAGVRVKFTVDFRDGGNFPLLIVFGDRMDPSRRNTNCDGGLMALYVGCMSNNPTPYNYQRYEQIQLIHEIGHALGLDHPGQNDVLEKEVPNSFEDYAADPDSLMGLGMKLSKEDFDNAFCSHIPEDK